jgi:hypothetical protein
MAALVFQKFVPNFSPMKFQSLPVRLLCLPVAASLALSGCSNLTPGENAAVAGVATSLAVGLPLALIGVNHADDMVLNDQDTSGSRSRSQE